MSLRNDIVKAVEKGGIFGRCVLQVDGYRVVATIRPLSPYRNVVMVYVDGQIKGENFGATPSCRDELPEIARRFYDVKFHRLWKPAQRAKLKRLGKREAEKLGIDKGFYQARPYFSTAEAFAKSLLRNNASVTLVEAPEVAA
jgi:hypothetical protein